MMILRDHGANVVFHASNIVCIEEGKQDSHVPCLISPVVPEEKRG